MASLTDAAWRAIVHARGYVRGKVFRMSMGTMMAIQADRGQPWYPEVIYHLYGVPVRYNQELKYGQITLEKP